MLNAPMPPDILVTRQIECISCKEVFTIAEDDAIRKRRRTDQWRVPPDHYPDTQLRYQPNRTRRPVTPEAHANPAVDPDEYLGWKPDRWDYVNCPRCGTDNRNWLHLMNPPEGLVPLYLQRFPLVIIGFLVMVAIFFAAVFLYFRPNELREAGELRRSLALIVAIFLGGYLPLILIPPQWKRLREYSHLRRVATRRPIVDISPPSRTGLILFIIFVFLVPFVLFILIPWTFGQGIELLAPEEELTLVQRIDRVSTQLPAAINRAAEAEVEPARNAVTSLEAMVDEQGFRCERTQVEALIARLQLLPAANASEHKAALIANARESLQALNEANQSACKPELVQNAINSLEVLRAFEEGQCQPHHGTDALPPGCRTLLIEGIIRDLRRLQDPPAPRTGTLAERASMVLGQVRQRAQGSIDAAGVQRIESNVNTLERFIGPEDPGWFTVGREFLRNWVWFVGLVSLASVVTSLFAVDRYARYADYHLPRPIIYSVANMTRVVIWEAKRSLEIDGDMSHVRWTKVDRNANGGITLHGLHHDVFEPGQKVDPLFQKVRAQHYTISSDPWGRIVTANVKDVRVQRPPERPGLGMEFFQRVPVPPQRERVPVP
ncbi:MAG TPA: hypothetical protein VF177_06810 [Anaerolineae bacterium]